MKIIQITIASLITFSALNTYSTTQDQIKINIYKSYNIQSGDCPGADDMVGAMADVIEDKIGYYKNKIKLLNEVLEARDSDIKQALSYCENHIEETKLKKEQLTKQKEELELEMMKYKFEFDANQTQKQEFLKRYQKKQLTSQCDWYVSRLDSMPPVQTEYSKDQCEKSMRPGVKIGMTTKQVIEKTSWGRPESVNRSVGNWGVDEQWVYGGGNYLYFRNGRLTSYQN
ncbi:hypothetical protein HUU62_13020 [Rhodoferax sp. 4810]|nr:hypothetical protein [Rhodoferax jenense]